MKKYYIGLKLYNINIISILFTIMIVMIPLGGTGERFKYLNYNRPKALINALGKPILYYLLDSIKCEEGDIQTIYGDYLYDWAKLYQSLLGYDLILQDKEVSVKYKNDLISYFEKYFIELFSRDTLNDLKNITNSLFFTLIPLHDNEKCEKYYELIIY